MPSHEQSLREACQAALQAFRDLYDRMENGEEIDDLLNDKTLWPLTQLREAIAYIPNDQETIP